MAIGALNSGALMESYILKGGTLTNYINGLAKNNSSLFQVQPPKQNTSSSSMLNSSLFSSLGDISKSAAMLKSQMPTMASLAPPSTSFGKTASYSNKDNILTANVTNNAPVSSYTKTDVNVQQLAATQQNKGTALVATDNSFGTQFSMSITSSEGKTSNFNVNLSGTDNNRTAMQSMADQINKSTVGVKATVSYDAQAGTASLIFESAKTGETDGKFTVTDSSAANLGNVARQSQNAEYSVNGQSFSSQTNEKVKITDGVTATLNKTGSTQMTYSADVGNAVDKVKSFIDNFNALKDNASKSGELNAQLAVLTGTFNRGLNFSGIGMDSGGKLKINNEDTLKNSLASGSFAKNFQGVGSFGDKLSKITANAYKTAYSSAVKDNLNQFLKSMNDNNNSFNNWLPQQGGGLLFNGWA